MAKVLKPRQSWNSASTASSYFEEVIELSDGGMTDEEIEEIEELTCEDEEVLEEITCGDEDLEYIEEEEVISLEKTDDEYDSNFEDDSTSFDPNTEIRATNTYSGHYSACLTDQAHHADIHNVQPDTTLEVDDSFLLQLPKDEAERMQRQMSALTCDFSASVDEFEFELTDSEHERPLVIEVAESPEGGISNPDVTPAQPLSPVNPTTPQSDPVRALPSPSNSGSGVGLAERSRPSPRGRRTPQSASRRNRKFVPTTLGTLEEEIPRGSSSSMDVTTRSGSLTLPSPPELDGGTETTPNVATSGDSLPEVDSTHKTQQPPTAAETTLPPNLEEFTQPLKSPTESKPDTHQMLHSSLGEFTQPLKSDDSKENQTNGMPRRWSGPEMNRESNNRRSFRRRYSETPSRKTNHSNRTTPRVSRFDVLLRRSYQLPAIPAG